MTCPTPCADVTSFRKPTSARRFRWTPTPRRAVDPLTDVRGSEGVLHFDVVDDALPNVSPRGPHPAFGHLLPAGEGFQNASPTGRGRRGSGG